MTTITRLTTSLLLASVLLIVVACESKVSIDNYQQITKGMTIAQVEGILGSGTEDTSSGGTSISGGGLMSGSDAAKERVFVWKDKGKQITVIFAAGKVVETRQTGLQ
ncbi:MAG: hypothetical protein KF745_07830 [Phycisphaeraceae bacterium]|nr:hypothetical protein [Phycisphaeraceae bacterium]